MYINVVGSIRTLHVVLPLETNKKNRTKKKKSPNRPRGPILKNEIEVNDPLDPKIPHKKFGGLWSSFFLGSVRAHIYTHTL